MPVRQAEGEDNMPFDMFGEVEKLATGLDASWKRNEVIMNNIANNDTPEFKRSSLAFEEHYKAALKNESDFVLKRTRDKHIDKGAGDGSLMTVEVDESETMRMDGNNVDIEKEMSDLASNVIYYQTLQKKVSSELSQLSIAIKGS